MPSKSKVRAQICRHKLFASNICGEDLTITRTPPNSDDDDFPDINELLWGMMQRNNSASVDPTDVDGSFVDTDGFMSGVQQKSVPAGADPNSGGMAEKVDDGTRGGSPADSSRSTVGSSQGEHPASLNLSRDFFTHTTSDPIILSDDEPAGAESETDYSDLDIDLTTKSSVDPPHVADSGLADGDGSVSGTARTSARRVADYEGDDDSYNNVVDNSQLRLAVDRPTAASPNRGSLTHQARKLQVDTDITQESMSFVDLDVSKEWEDEGSNVLAEGHRHDDDDGGDTRSTKRRKLSALSNTNLAFDTRLSRLQDGQPDHAQSPQPRPAAASLHPSDSENNQLRKQLCGRGAARNVYLKRPRAAAPFGLASTASTQSRPLVTAPSPERELCDINQEMVNGGSADDSDEDSDEDSDDAASSQIGGRPRSRKRVRRTKDTEDDDVATPSTHSLDASYQAAAGTSSSGMHESEEIPIHGYFTLKMVQSKVVYYLTFSQEVLPRPRDRWQRQATTTNLEEPQSTAPVADPDHRWGIRKIIGQKIVGCERQYRVEWKDTWMPESELTGAKELVDAFMANGGGRTSGRKRPLKRGRPATGQPDARGEEEPKKRRGRPRRVARTVDGFGNQLHQDLAKEAIGTVYLAL